MTYTIEKVTTLIGAHRFGNADANIGFLLTDSRSLCFAEETLFFALKSGRGDGHNYISDLYRLPACGELACSIATTCRTPPRRIQHSNRRHHWFKRQDHC